MGDGYRRWDGFTQPINITSKTDDIEFTLGKKFSVRSRVVIWAWNWNSFIRKHKIRRQHSHVINGCAKRQCECYVRVQPAIGIINSRCNIHLLQRSNAFSVVIRRPLLKKNCFILEIYAIQCRVTYTLGTLWAMYLGSAIRYPKILPYRSSLWIYFTKRNSSMRESRDPGQWLLHLHQHHKCRTEFGILRIAAANTLLIIHFSMCIEFACESSTGEPDVRATCHRCPVV